MWLGYFAQSDKTSDRVVMHDVRVTLLRQQAESAGLPLHIIEIPYPCSKDEYASAISAFVDFARKENIECFAFGDLLPEDVRQYRENCLSGTGITPIFWDIPTKIIARKTVAGGLFDGSMFQNPIDVVSGETVYRDGFVFTDLLPFTSNSEPTH